MSFQDDAFQLDAFQFDSAPAYYRGRSLMLDPVVWSIQGRVLDAVDWSANTSLGGYDQARVTAPLDQIDDLLQGQVLTATLPGGEVIWQGRLVSDVTPRWDGLADLDATGFRSDADWRSGRLLFQTKDYTLFSDGSGDPYNFTGSSANVQVSSESNSLQYVVAPASADPPGLGSLAMWAPNTPGGLTRYAFDIALYGVGSSGSSTLVVKRFTGPTGARTTVATHTISSPSTALSVDQTVSSAEDGLVIEGSPGLYYDPVNTFVIKVYNLRVNGIAVGDTMSPSQIIANIGGRCGYDTNTVAGAGVNALPYDLQSGSWMDGISYLSSLDGGKVALVLGGDAPRMDYRKYEDRTYEVRLAEGAQPTLKPNPRGNFIRVLYSLPDGSPIETLKAVPFSDLPEGIVAVSTYAISDPQADSSLASALVSALGPEVSRHSWTGSISGVVMARQDGVGEIDPRQIEPGSTVRISDWDAVAGRELRISDVGLSPDGVTLGIEASQSASDSLAAGWSLDRSHGMLPRPYRPWHGITDAPGQNIMPSGWLPDPVSS